MFLTTLFLRSTYAHSAHDSASAAEAATEDNDTIYARTAYIHSYIHTAQRPPPGPESANRTTEEVVPWV